MILLCPYVPPQWPNANCYPLTTELRIASGRVNNERYHRISYDVGRSVYVEVIPIFKGDME